MKCLMLTALMGVVVLTGCAEDGVQNQGAVARKPAVLEEAPTGSLIKRRANSNSSDASDGNRMQMLAHSHGAENRARLG